MIILETNRLILRTFEEGDIDLMTLIDQDPQVYEFLPSIGNREKTMFDELKNNLAKLIPIIFVGGFAACAVLVATGVSFCCARQLYLHARDDSKLFNQTELAAFYEKYGPSPPASISTSATSLLK